MGGQYSKFKSKLQGKGKAETPYGPQVLFFGPFGGGKSTVKHQLAHGSLDSFEETQWFHHDHDSANVEGEELGLWDISSREGSRPILHLYFAQKDAFVFVIDSSDVAEIDNTLLELNNPFFTDERTNNKILMVLANKQDLEGALPVEKIEEKVQESIVSAHGPTAGGRFIFVKGCSAKTGEGVQEAFSCFLEFIRLQKVRKLTPGFRTLHLHQDDKNDDNTNKEDKVDGKDENEKQLDYILKLYDNAPSVKSILCD